MIVTSTAADSLRIFLTSLRAHSKPVKPLPTITTDVIERPLHGPHGAVLEVPAEGTFNPGGSRPHSGYPPGMDGDVLELLPVLYTQTRATE
jgi:hypothetical protein